MILSEFYTKESLQMKNAILTDIDKMIREYGLNDKEISWCETYAIIEHNSLLWLTDIDENHPVDMVAIEHIGSGGAYNYRLEVGIDGVHYRIVQLNNMLDILRALERYFGLDKSNSL